MITIHLILPDGSQKQGSYPQDTTAENVYQSLADQLPYEILLCEINGRVRSLTSRLQDQDTLRLLDMRNAGANMTYQSSLTLLYIKAVHDVLGKQIAVNIWNSLNKGLYTTIRSDGVSADVVSKIQQQMISLRDQNLPFSSHRADRSELESWMKKENRTEELRLLDSAPDFDDAELCTFADEQDVMFNKMVPSSGYLKWFELRKYHNGVLLRFPHPSKPNEIPPYEDQTLLYSAFSEATRWDKICQVDNAADLNELMNRNDYEELVLLNEALHEKRIAEIAEMIHASGKRIVLIAGPSSSGKTSFAKRLCIQLRVIGLKPLYLGTDDYFLNRDETPLLPNGEKDYESLAALDIKLFTQQMNDLLDGKKVDLPSFDFKTGVKQFGHRILSIDSTQPIVMEGIHGLNPELTKGIPDEAKFRIYISPLTQLNIDSHNRIPTTDARMLRRMVRDKQFRGYSATHTIHTWPTVRSGEDQYIFPYNGLADVFFNSALVYELAVLKKYAMPLLKEISPETPEFPEASRMIEFLEFFAAMPDDSIIPNNSIMREFIGGSVLVH